MTVSNINYKLHSSWARDIEFGTFCYTLKTSDKLNLSIRFVIGVDINANVNICINVSTNAILILISKLKLINTD